MDLKIINEYTLMKHNILPGTQQNRIEDVSRNHLGLHSARIMTPYITLCSRLHSYTPQMLMSQLYKERNLIKMRCMRTTLHIAPFDIASMLHMATLDLRLSECKLFFKNNDISIERVEELEEELIHFVNVPKTAPEIERLILEKISFWNTGHKKECAKKILKYFWEMGTFCYVNAADDWEKEERRYAVTRHFYPDIDLNQCDKWRAQELLVLEYIKKFGPATIKDISWWSGLSLKVIRDVLERHRSSIVTFRVNDFDKEFLMSVEEFSKLEKYELLDSEWITLLAYEDPSLKGYYESRCRYVDEEFYDMLFNQIGEVRASILYNGKAIGVWEWDKKDKGIKVNFFVQPDKSLKKRVWEIKEEYESMLCQNRQMTLFDSMF